MGFRRNSNKATETKQEEVKSTPQKASKSSGGGGGKTYHNNALTVMVGKDGDPYIVINNKFEGEITVNGKKVTQIFTKHPMKELEESVEAGRLSEEKAEQIAAKIPEYIVGNVTLVTE